MLLKPGSLHRQKKINYRNAVSDPTLGLLPFELAFRKNCCCELVRNSCKSLILLASLLSGKLLFTVKNRISMIIE